MKERAGAGFIQHNNKLYIIGEFVNFRRL